MRVMVTGATGFVGRHVVAALLESGHDILAIGRHAGRFEEMPWRTRVRTIACDIHTAQIETALQFSPDVLVHLAWPGLPNYRAAFHVEKNLPADKVFLDRAIAAGVHHVLVAGTGAEFGLLSGELDEDADTAPVSAYGMAKDGLRRYLQQLQVVRPLTFQWVRLFHIHGPGQNPGSLLAQLDKAIDTGAAQFDMSGGEQLRDYLPVEDVAKRIAYLVKHPEIQGTINCCSGRPISIRTLVEQRIAQRGAKIKLNLNAYPYPDYEPMAYWGKVGKLRIVEAASSGDVDESSG